MKKILSILYVVVILCMGIATIVEKYEGTEYVQASIYGSWWFSVLWALLASAGIAWFVGRRVKRISVVLLHLSFVIILLGALLTHLTAKQGMMHLRVGETARHYAPADAPADTTALPFSIRLDQFATRYHEGTHAASDYISTVTILHGKEQEKGTVAMNKILSFRGIRFYQSSFDEDMGGSWLSVNSDPWGIPVTYTGYALLFIALLWILVDPRGAYRKVIREAKGIGAENVETEKQDSPRRGGRPWLRRMAVAAAVLVTVIAVLIFRGKPKESVSAPVLPKETAAEFGKLNILYNDRICPLQTFALDFTKKLYGKRSYRGCSAEQVLTGFIFWGEEWSREPIIKTKGAVREQWQLPKYCSVNTFFNADMGGYILGPDLQEYYQGNNDKYHKDVAKIDDKLSLIMQLRQGKPLKIFPFKGDWYSPTDKMPADMEPERQEYMANIFSLLYQDALTGNHGEMNEALSKMQKYQVRYGGNALPSATKVKAERIYNRFPIATILFMLNLTLGFLSMAAFFRSRKSVSSQWIGKYAFPLILLLSFVLLTGCLALRWIISDNVPMSNGYETMLLMAWIIMLMSLLIFRRFPIIITFGFLLSGFFLLVSHISQMDPQITHLMPVLSSPLLTFHVSIIMTAYSLLSVTFICGVAFLVRSKRQEARLGKQEARGKKQEISIEKNRGERIRGEYFRGERQEDSLFVLSRLFLYPALTCLGFGIFIGAIWANISWGTYWSWDPKETWALITFMVYGIAVHHKSLPWLAKPLGYHLFMTLAFLTILMTYFGVNYFLGGMHSYA